MADPTAPGAGPYAAALPSYLADGDPVPPPPRRSGWRRWLPLALVIVVVAGSAIGMLTYLGMDLGPQAFLIGLVAAVLPVPVLVSIYLWLDRYEPEPPWLLAGAFAWGAFPATLLALGVNKFFFEVVGWSDAVVATVVAPVIEESGKALGPLLIFWFMRRELSGVTDGLVYCGLSGVGFAMVENILYLGGHGFADANSQYGPYSGAQLVFTMFLMRILLSGFAHPLFTSMTGVGIGIAARTPRRVVRWCAPICGLLLAMIMHGSWNLMAVLSAEYSPLFFLYGYIAVMMPVFLTMIGVALWVRAREGGLALQVLPAYAAAGWLTPPEVASLGTLGRRHAAKVWARRVAGDTGRRAMRDFQFAATRLALVRDGMNRGLDTTEAQRAESAAEEAQLLSRLAAARQVYAGRDPQMPPAHWDGSSYQVVFPDGVARPVPAPAEPVVPLPMLLPPPPPPPPGYPHYPPQPYFGSGPAAG
ncbi:PrsW family intramembrane metalloprotease [Catellatospora sp. KI3]|uniref:PrsW family intramembrane metalloprotease n=1 Tax=Catellatospora sp. KI3 TaxID=3041620 RepID=UPI002482CBA7|nr:PrsW family intramembrane metalloprotease [Catellatospora sp. KI3]MDI1465799.1 PrsW family intramembrane metalloprotease [Catellatospora sp. KI3]